MRMGDIEIGKESKMSRVPFQGVKYVCPEHTCKGAVDR